MATTYQKPLPSIPRGTEVPRNLTNLTVEGREHLRTLIHTALAEEDQPCLSGGGRESWTNALESALDVLADNIGRGGWLTGVKRGRIARKVRKAEELKKSEAQKVKKEQDDVTKSKAKGKGDTLEEAPRREDKELPKKPSSTLTTENQAESSDLPLQQIRDLLARPTTPAPKPYAKHLILCLVPIGRPVPNEDSGFDLVPHDTSCTFTPGFFSLPEALSDKTESGILFGLREWDVNMFPYDDDSMRIIGGSFVFNGVTSLTEHQALSKVLRIAIYVQLSLILEQNVLSDSNVALNLSKTRISLPRFLTLPAIEPEPPSSDIKKKSRSSLLPASLKSFISKKTESIFRRTSGMSLGRTGSLDLRPSGIGPLTPRSSEDNALGRLRKLSFLHDSRSPPPQTEINAATDAPFASILKRLEQNRNILSSSPGISLAPPSLIVNLATEETRDPSRSLLANEKAGLNSILGWEGRESQGRGMIGMLGFLRHQEFSVLHSRHVPAHPPASSDTSSSSSLDSPAVQNPTVPISTPCEKARWITYTYYSRDSGSDKTLGDAIVDLCSSADNHCNRPGCHFKRGEHELRLIHSGLRITIKVGHREIHEGTSQNDIVEMWQTCKTCGAKSRQKPMSDGTYLFSFAKFLELLCYSPAICTPAPPLCEHTTPPSQAEPTPNSLPKSRLEIIRHFSYQTHSVAIGLTAVDDIFELQFPKLQISRTNGSLSSSETWSEPSSTSRDSNLSGNSAEKKALRYEIKSWWQGVAEHIDKLEAIFTGDLPNSFSKSLPRLPSTGDYDDLDAPMDLTPKAHPLDLPSEAASTPATLLVPSRPTLGATSTLNSGTVTPKVRDLAPGTSSDLPHEFEPSNVDDTSSLTDSPPPIPKKDGYDTDNLHRLQSLRDSFQRTEQSLYISLSHTSSLNDVRLYFLSAACGATRRLLAWQEKHVPKGQQLIGDLTVQEPEWWKKSCHVLGGGNIIVRNDDWGSIIAFTLSSPDYRRELTNMSVTRMGSSVPSVPSPSVTTSTDQSSFFGSNAAYGLFSSPSVKPDPDQEDIIWHESEVYSAVISRKEHPRDQASLLSLLRNKTPVEGSSGLPSRIGSLDSSNSHNVGDVVPPSAWAKPAVEVTKHAVGGKVSGLPEVPDNDTSKFHAVEGQVASLISGDSSSTIGPTNSTTTEPPPLPPKDIESSPPAATSSFFTSSITNAVRYMLNTGEYPRSAPPSSNNQQNVLISNSTPIDERPHIKYDWSIGKRLKFSCTVYYAKQFDNLRRRCGIEDVFLRSLGRSANWAAEGGKSKSNFWKTSDDRFIIKTLVNAWNVADLSALIDLAPSYFQYMETTASVPTALAKLLGFYTVEIKNLENGNTQAKADLLLMENLFYDQKIGKTFDLKGIQGRKVKTGSSTSSQSPNNKTLFDGEWIEGQQRALMLVRSHSKVILRDAIKNDCDFLSKSNIMDYSLLLGIDDGQKRISCGLVDTIGSYTFAKTLEYKAKQGLNSGKDVTVIPPIEYQARFVKALDGYFLACPDKWSRPLDNAKVIDDASLLPSVL